jgi:hypothetical protein
VKTFEREKMIKNFTGVTVKWPIIVSKSLFDLKVKGFQGKFGRPSSFQHGCFYVHPLIVKSILLGTRHSFDNQDII